LNDNHPEAKKIIEANMISLKIDQVKASQQDAIEFIQFANLNKLQFNIVFLDPPYAYSDQSNLFNQLFKGNILLPGSIVVYENESELHDFNEDKFIVKSYNYGRTYVHIGWKK